MGWLNWDERRKVFKETKIQAEYICDHCGEPIAASELPVIDPKGGYYPKDEGQPDFLPKKPKKSYHRKCQDIRSGKRPKVEQELPQKKSPKETQQSPEPKVKLKNNGHASKKLIKVAEAILEALRKRPKHKWSVWELVLALRDTYSQAEIRGAANYLKTEGLMTRKNGVLRPTSTKP